MLALLLPVVALAHPLGNFTINHFAAIRVSPDQVSLDIVIDRAEIPAFQEQQRLDTNGDGALAAGELAGQDRAACLALAPDLRLSVDGRALAPTLFAAGLTLPPGSGGLPTMRLVCGFSAAWAAPITSPAVVAFEDRSFPERIGWREIVVLGDRLTVAGAASGASAGGASDRLTSYPSDLLAQPLDMRAIRVELAPGGPALPPWTAPDARPIAAGGPGADPPASQTSVIPGGVADDLAALIDVTDLTPLAILASLAVAIALGVVHALSPGHGKTIMAAYLVGGRRSTRQAIGLGLAVAVSHTLGVLVLAGITLAASSLLPPERLYPILGVVSGALVIAIGASLLWGRVRDVARARKAAGSHRHRHGHEDGDDPDHGHGHTHPHPHPHPHPNPDAGGAISWRGLIALGLSGGLVPSASALILLLGSMAAGRVAYGLVLVAGFGVGMALVLAGVGLLLVHAQLFVERRLAGGRPTVEGIRRLAVPAQLATASLVVVLGVVLTGQALTQVL
jgi:ABC-type nickel/cobalt efflux system permease component RcnA